MGYYRAGFDIVGVDLYPQPYYPFPFVRADAVTFPVRGVQAVHASPPCHDHSTASRDDDGTGWMLAATVDRLAGLGIPWVVENVVGPDVRMAGWWVTLCGSMFGLKVRRHRRFGSNVLVLAPDCDHAGQGRPYTVTGNGQSRPYPHSLKPRTGEFWRYLGMPWMAGKPDYGVAQAIPPAYTQHIGAQLIRAC